MCIEQVHRRVETAARVNELNRAAFKQTVRSVESVPVSCFGRFHRGFALCTLFSGAIGCSVSRACMYRCQIPASLSLLVKAHLPCFQISSSDHVQAGSVCRAGAAVLWQVQDYQAVDGPVRHYHAIQHHPPHCWSCDKQLGQGKHSLLLHALAANQRAEHRAFQSLSACASNLCRRQNGQPVHGERQQLQN